MRAGIVLLAVASVLAAGFLAPTARAGSGGAPTHIQLVSPASATVGVDVTLMGVLHDTTSNQAIPGATLSFYMRATFGWLPLGNGTTNAQGKAAVDFRPLEAGDFTFLVRFDGDGSHAPANATEALAVLAGAPAPPPFLPPDLVIALIVLATVGSVWATYGFVAWQVVQIRADVPENAKASRRAESKSRRKRAKEAMKMEGEPQAPKGAPASSNKPNRSALTLAAVAIAIAAVALALAGITALPKAPGYTPGTIELQITVVPDLKGEAWDAWMPNELVVHKGDLVKITVVNADTMEHGFKIAALGVDQNIPGATADAAGAITPSETLITLTADQVGHFLIECNVVCGVGHEYMTGTLVVLPG